MKSKIISILLVFLLSTSITACSSNQSSSKTVNSSTTSNNKNISNLNSNNAANNNETSNTNVSKTSSPTQSSDTSSSKDASTQAQVSSVNNNNSVMEAYNSVLQNKIQFFSTDNKKNVYLNNFLSNNGIYQAVFKATHFTVLDMDGDNIPEVVLELSVGDNPQFYEILHYMNGQVYGYLQVYRGLEQLKTDGTFWASGGASDNVCGKLTFTTNAYKINILASVQPSNGGVNSPISYSINNKPVTKEAFDTFIKEQNGKKDVTWSEFSENNIKTKLCF